MDRDLIPTELLPAYYVVIHGIMSIRKDEVPRGAKAQNLGGLEHLIAAINDKAHLHPDARRPPRVKLMLVSEETDTSATSSVIQYTLYMVNREKR